MSRALRSFTQHLLSLLAFAIVVSCAGQPSEQLEPTISRFAAEPLTISRGESAVLTWEVHGASEIQVTPGAPNVSARAELRVSPTEDTTYQLTARNAVGVVSEALSIRVVAPTPPGPPAPGMPAPTEPTPPAPTEPDPIEPDPTPPEPIEPDPPPANAVTNVAIDQGDQLMEIGATRNLTATVVTQGGAPDTVSWGSSNTSVATINGGGTLEAVGAGTATVKATSTHDPSKSAQITVQVTSQAPSSGFKIDLQFSPAVTPSQQAVFRTAAERWEQVITHPLSATRYEKQANRCGQGEPAVDITVDGVMIYADIKSIDGPYGILGSAGPCSIRRSDGLPIYGTMTFDSDDVAMLQEEGKLQSVILHEMGHVLGIGTLWPIHQLLVFDGATCQASTVVEYTGTYAALEWSALGGAGATPVENLYGTGTKCGHWKEAVFTTELMTGFAGPGSKLPLSRLTIASLSDLGYIVDLGAADSYSLPSCSPNCVRAASSPTEHSHTVLLKPKFEVLPGGEVEPLDR